MPSPSDAKPATPHKAQRPSLLGGTAPSKSSNPRSLDADPSGFGVSILAAIDDSPCAKRAVAAKPSSARKNNWMWWLGIAVVAIGLLGAAQWQRSQAAAQKQPVAATASTSLAPAPVKVAPMPAAPVVVAIEPREISSPPIAGLVNATAAASSPFSALDASTSVATTPPVSTQAARPSSEGKTNPSSAERKAPSQRETPARAQAAATPKPTLTKDADAELLAALMAHSDGTKEAAKSKAAAPQPINEAERRRFSTKLRECRNKGTATAREDCRMAACQAANYWGRTKSCPAGGANAFPTRTAAS
ncbi:MAG: hypothetical protein ACK5O3_07715 [Burkholderiales bacterium]